MRVRDLGALLVDLDGRVQPVVGRKGPAMLALLTINVNQRVSTDALMEAAWGRGSAGSTSTLESHVWRLRQILEPSRTSRQPPSVLVSDAGGFRLVGGPASIDSLAFADAAFEVDNLVAAGDVQAAIRRVETARTWWRGRPYGVFADEEWAQPAVARLEELHSLLRERYVEALLGAGAVDLALSELQPLIAAAPFREHVRELQLEALYRSGRAEQALQAYQDARRTLIDEVGIEPGVALQDLHRRILANDPALTRPTRIVVDTGRTGEVHLPVTLTPLVGRDTVVTELAALLVHERLLTVAGPAGCGKTRVAVEVARGAASDCPDGVWFVDLTEVADPDLVVDLIGSTIGLAPAAGATPHEALRSYLLSRRMLLVLDNCEHVLAAVAHIIEMTLGDASLTPECRFLTTSREPLAVDGEVVWSLMPLALPEDIVDADPRRASAVELFMQRLRSAAPSLSVDELALHQAVQICHAVDGLPLPLELAAARAATYTLSDIAEQVAADPGRLGRVGRGPRDHRRTVRTAIEWSHQLLPADLQMAHRRLSVLPGTFTADLARSVLIGSGPLTDDPEDLLAQLVHRSLLVSNVADGGAVRTTTFRQLATVRSHARHALEGSGETELCHHQRDTWTSTLLQRRPPLGARSEIGWYQHLDDNSATIRATLARQLIERPAPAGGLLPSRLSFYWYYREQLVEGSKWLQLAHNILRGQDPADVLLAQISLAAGLAAQGRLDLARPYLSEVLQALPPTSPERMIEIGEAMVGLSTAVWPRDDYALIVDLHRQLSRIVERSESSNLQLLADAIDCHVSFVQDRVEESIAQAESVRERARAADNLMAGWLVSGPPMIVAMMTGKSADGIRWVNDSLSDHLQLGTGASGLFIENRANFAAIEGDYLHAAQLFAAARVETRRAGMPWPRRPLTQQLIVTTQEYLSRTDYERAWREGERLTVHQILDMS